MAKKPTLEVYRQWLINEFDRGEFLALILEPGKSGDTVRAHFALNFKTRPIQKRKKYQAFDYVASNCAKLVLPKFTRWAKVGSLPISCLVELK